MTTIYLDARGSRVRPGSPTRPAPTGAAEGFREKLEAVLEQLGLERDHLAEHLLRVVARPHPRRPTGHSFVMHWTRDPSEIPVGPLSAWQAASLTALRSGVSPKGGGVEHRFPGERWSATGQRLAGGLRQGCPAPDAREALRGHRRIDKHRPPRLDAGLGARARGSIPQWNRTSHNPPRSRQDTIGGNTASNLNSQNT